MRHSILAGLLLASALMPTAASALPNHGALALDNVRIIEPEHDRVSAPRCVRVEGKRLTHIAKASAESCLRNARVVDLQGRYLMPGLIDMHAHLTLGPLEIKRERGRATMQALADDDIAQHNGRRLVAFGVTTLRNPGGDLAGTGCGCRQRRQRRQLAAGTKPLAFFAQLAIRPTL